MIPSTRATKKRASDDAPPAEQASKRPRRGGTTLPPPSPAAPVPSDINDIDLSVIKGPKTTYPTVKYLVKRSFSQEEAEAMVVAFKQLAATDKQHLLTHENGILTKVKVPGAINDEQPRIVPGALTPRPRGPGRRKGPSAAH